MEAAEAARATTDAVVNLPAGFMLDGATYARGAELGFEGMDFYVAGRGGALGDVAGSVVAATFVYFNPTSITEAWDRSQPVMARHDAAAAFASCLVSWADGHLADGVDYGRLAALTDRVLDAASPAGAPLFAAWRAVPEPTEPKARALHRMHVLRELRGAIHGAAILASGLQPLEAVLIKTPYMAALFGWTEPYPDIESGRGQWDQAEKSTNRVLGRAYGALDPAERAELVDLMEGAHKAAT